MITLESVEVGTVLPTVVISDITRTTLALFAGSSGDHNPIHIDIDSARAAGLDDVFAQGMLSMAYLGRVLTNWVPQSRVRSFEVRFTSITPVHAGPTCSGRVLSIDIVDGERLATVELAVTLADGTLTLSGGAIIAIDSLQEQE